MSAGWSTCRDPMTHATYFESFDVKELLSQFPMDQAFTDKFRNHIQS